MHNNIKSIKVSQSNVGYRYITFSNHDGKEWSIPVENMRVGLEIYEPSGAKGKILKYGMPVLSKMFGSRIVPESIPGDLILSDPFQDLLKALYDKYEVSVFWGTPSTDQKVTVQIFDGDKICGYCKIGTSNRVFNLFQNEENILNVLKQCNVENVPQCKGIFLLNDNERAFVQTTKKKPGSKTIHEFGKEHEHFLQEMYDKTREHIAFEKTDFYKSLVFIIDNVDELSAEYRNCVLKTANAILQEYKNQQVLWGVFHRDFTPWNTCMVNQHLFVFDFEYAHRHAPRCLDRWHFYTQTAIYEKRMSADEIAADFLKKYKSCIEEYKMYLIDNISLYIMRGCCDDIKIANQKAQILYQLKQGLQGL